jgi:signal peptidase I
VTGDDETHRADDRPDIADLDAPYDDLHGETEPAPSDVPGDDDADDLEAEPKPEKDAPSFWRELPLLVLIALVLAVIVKTFFVQAFWIPSESMDDTLVVGDRVLVNKLSYRFGEVKRGQVVVFDPREKTNDESLPAKVVRNVLESIGVATPKSDLIKRVIGLPGETIEVRQRTVLIDGERLDEPWLPDSVTSMGDPFGPMTVPEGEYFVMGDNRTHSSDSRAIGTIREDQIIGRAFVILWPPGSWSGL